MLTRRQILTLVPAAGISSAIFARALAQQAAGQLQITRAMLADASWISGIQLSDEEEDALLKSVDALQKQLLQLREIPLDPQDDLPALVMQARSPTRLVDSASEPKVAASDSIAPLQRPENDAELAFLPAYQLAALLRSRQVSSVELTRLYLSRLKQYDPQLLCVVNLTEELALQQAEQADHELATGKVRSPLHGIPWGAKDLISVAGYPTTWGIPVFKDRTIERTATVAQRLFDAGAVLVAKLSLGAIAMGDQWFGGMTRNPWNLEEGSSGSSAGSCSASSAGLVGFALGSETLGSILTPSRRCASHGLRPTFGRVSRAGCMPLSWSMDKIGPIGRSVEDLALVLAVIHGEDGQDPSVRDSDFVWPPRPVELSALKVGVLAGSENDPAVQRLQRLGCQLVEVQLPSGYPFSALTKIIDIEGAAVFDSLLRAGDTEGWNSWTKSFQSAQYITAIDYLRMQRVRRKLMAEFEMVMQQVDLLFNARDLVHTNFTGHPSVTIPFVTADAPANQKPESVVITGQLFGEERLLAVARAFEGLAESSLPKPALPD